MIRGRVQHGIILLDDPQALPEGTVVSVRPLAAGARDTDAMRGKSSVSSKLLRLAGKAQGIPPDASRNVDHYLYGHRKR